MNKIFTTILTIALIIPAFYVPEVAHGATDIKNDATLGSGLVSAWLMQSADIPGDASSTNDGTNTGVTSSSTCPSGTDPTCGYFVLSETDNISFAQDDSLNPQTEDWSIAMWFNLNSLNTAGGSDTLWRNWDNAIDRRTIFFHCEPVTCGTNDLQLYIDTNGLTSGGVLVYDSTDFDLVEDTWYHVGFSFDYSTGVASFFKNGAALGTEDLGDSIDPSYTSTMPALISYSASNVGIDGTMAQVLFYERLVTEAEFSSLYASGAGIPYEAAAGAAAEDPEVFIIFSLIAPLKPFFV